MIFRRWSQLSRIGPGGPPAGSQFSISQSMSAASYRSWRGLRVTSWYVDANSLRRSAHLVLHVRSGLAILRAVERAVGAMKRIGSVIGGSTAALQARANLELPQRLLVQGQLGACYVRSLLIGIHRPVHCSLLISRCRLTRWVPRDLSGRDRADGSLDVLKKRRFVICITRRLVNRAVLKRMPVRGKSG
jgi:hypothetical protein